MESKYQFNYSEAFSRNIGVLTKEQQEKLKHSTVAIAGLGGAGGIYATTFARLGFGNFRIADMDIFEVVNMNRQAAASMDVMGQEKVSVVEKLVHAINPEANVQLFPQGLTESNVDEFLKGADMVLDGIDFFNIDARRMMYQHARQQNVYVIIAGPIAYGSSMLVFDPNGMSFDDYFDLKDSQSENEKLVRFGLGLTPTLLQRHYFKPQTLKLNDQRAPSVVTGTLLCANLASTEALRLVFGEPMRVAPSSLHFDPYLRKLKKVWIPWGNKNPIQRLKRIIVTMVLKARGSW